MPRPLGRASRARTAAFLVSCVAACSALAWPSAGQWIPVYRNNAFVDDDIGDTNGSRNVVGDATNAAAFVFNDGTYLHFRLRLDDDPTGKGGQGLLQSFGWGVEFDTNLNGTDYEWLLMVDGIGTEEIALRQNTVQGTINDPGDSSEITAAVISLAANHQVNLANTSFNGDADYFLDWRFPYDTLKQETGLTDYSPMRFFFGSSSSTNALTENGADLAGASDLSTGFSDFVTPLGTRPTTGTVKFVADLAGNGDVTTMVSGETLYLRVDDPDQNYNRTGLNTVSVTVVSTAGDSEQLTLTETGLDTGVFTAALSSAGTPVTAGDGTLQVAPGDLVTVTYVDFIDADLNLNQIRSDTILVARPAISLTKSVDKATAPPGTELTYSVHYRNTGGAAAHTLIIIDTIPPNTSYVSGSLRLGNAASTYATAAAKTDALGDDEGQCDGTTAIFTITGIAADDGVPDAGADEGKVLFKVTID